MMAEKSEITVYGKTYRIKADLSSVEPQDLADYVNDKMHELSGGSAKPSTIDLAILTALNIAGELFELKDARAKSEKQNQADRKETDGKARHLIQLIEKELKAIESSKGAVR